MGGGTGNMGSRARPGLIPEPTRTISQDAILLRQALDAVGPPDFEQVMQNRSVYGTSIAIVRGNTVSATANFGVLDISTQLPVGPQSIFQVASLSKLVNAVAVLLLVDRGEVTLDEDICERIDWQPNHWDDVAPAPLTLRQLLRHSSGIQGAGTTLMQDGEFLPNPGGGYGGYWKNVVLPSTFEIVTGASRSATSAIERTHEPDTQISYSGAGITIVQYLIEQITGLAYSTWCTTEIFKPFAMFKSTFAIGPPAHMGVPGGIASGYEFDGGPVSGQRRNYPESAAAGLYSTAEDLARIIILLNNNGRLDGTRHLSKHLVDDMFTRYSAGGSSSFLGCFPFDDGYNHNGSNAGFQSALFGFPDADAGMVILTNSERGNFVASTAASIQTTFGW